MKSRADRLFRVKRLLRRALLGLLVGTILMTGLATLAAPDQSYQLVQGIITSGAGRMLSRAREANGTIGQVVAPEWSTDGHYQKVSGFWSRDAFLQVTPTPRPTPSYDKVMYLPLIASER